MNKFSLIIIGILMFPWLLAAVLWVWAHSWIDSRPHTVAEALVRGLCYLVRWLNAWATALDCAIDGYRTAKHLPIQPKAEAARQKLDAENEALERVAWEADNKKGRSPEADKAGDRPWLQAAARELRSWFADWFGFKYQRDTTTNY